jgi:hypothetical protein
MAPIFAAWLHFPDRKGLVSGIIMAGFGLGVCIYSFVTNRIVNPHNLPPNAIMTNDNDPICKKIVYYFFASGIAKRVGI